MPLSKTKENTSYINNIYFDDIGCAILWAKNNNKDISNIQIFTQDTHKYIKSNEVYFTINERTPMNYGFTPYKNKKNNMINFNEVKLRMLRGEHMANPKIRQKILGNLR
jgi:hypothetical protein